MNNYKNSDYAVNKHAKGIVYRFSDQIVEVTLEDYLAENPKSTEADFQELKALSDSIYHEQDIENNKQARRTVPLFDSDCASLASDSFERDFEERMDKRAVQNAACQLLTSGELTATQTERFFLYFYDGCSLREIARREGVSHVAVQKSIGLATEALKRFFSKQG